MTCVGLVGLDDSNSIVVALDYPIIIKTSSRGGILSFKPICMSCVDPIMEKIHQTDPGTFSLTEISFWAPSIDLIFPGFYWGLLTKGNLFREAPRCYWRA